MRKFIAMALFLSGTLVFTSCDGDDDPEPGSDNLGTAQEVLDSLASSLSLVLTTDANAAGYTTAADDFAWTADLFGSERAVITDTVEVSANITSDVTWSATSVYKLTQRITVTDGATLTIDPGTVVAGQAGNAPENAAALMIAKDGMLMAKGTAAAPIVFTSTADNGAAVTSAQTGLWGGLVILGEAPVSADTDSPQIEGVPAEDALGQYGGSSATDNSGEISYISIRHGGSEIFGGSEINGLTLGGVGSGTKISYVHIYANADDGVEFFGGSVSVSNIYVEEVQDDAIDVDQSYNGTISKFWVVVNSSSDEVLEIDGREGTLDQSFTLSEGTASAVGGASITSEFKSKAKATVTNVDMGGGKLKLLASFGDDDLTLEEDAALNTATGSLTFSQINASYEVVAELSDETVITSTVE